MGKVSRLIIKILHLFIQIYRIGISPILGYHCRFNPSCSQYALAAMEQHGLWGGVCLSVRRLLRCHPWCPGGFDPVPDKRYKR